MKVRKGSLRRRLTALCAVLIGIALAIAGIDEYRRERVAISANLRADLERIARLVAAGVERHANPTSSEGFAPFLATVVQTIPLQAAAYYGNDGSRIATAGDASLLPLQSDDAWPVGAQWVGSASMEQTAAGGAGRRVLVRSSGALVQARLQACLGSIAATAATTLAVLLAALHWLLARLLRPMTTLVESTARQQHYVASVTPPVDDEIAALAESFESMLTLLQEREAQLARAEERVEVNVRDRTADLTRALAAAEAATRAKSSFVANMSHEIRTPLNAVLGMAELALETEDPDEVREYLNVIRNAGTSLFGILCDILDLSKIESDKLELSPVATDIESLVLEALRPLTSRIEGKDLELVFELAPELAPAYLVDDVRLRQILTNLVGNALKFTEQGLVRVRFTLLHDLGGVHEIGIVVQDTGVGIPRDRLQAVFAPFTQADSSITRRFAGTGLGLSITERLTRLMGGFIKVESTVGQGATFDVRIPLEVATSPLPEPPNVPSGARLCVVSRSESVRNAIASIARRLHIEARAFPDHRALASGDALGDLDVVLLDDRDPDHDPEVCASLPMAAHGLRRVLLLTSYQDLANASARCRTSQFAGYLAKPVSARELAVRLTTLLRPQGAEVVAGPLATTPSEPRRSLDILVADDNPINQKLIDRMLSRDGHAVTMAENGRICCDLFAGRKFDLILMDMQMPVMNGVEATEEIRRDLGPEGKTVPIIALTANTTPEDREACLRSGMNEVLAKPVSLPRLRAVLAHFGSISTATP
ncbi:MAG: response regulator [Planctomycetota bacterium]